MEQPLEDGISALCSSAEGEMQEVFSMAKSLKM